ncbi:MAG: leucine-rich repeat protein [Lachnospiraceae bacterium]|nr:leucine-rich repeat protein [Lachnospiraceae bacterium]
MKKGLRKVMGLLFAMVVCLSVIGFKANTAKAAEIDVSVGGYDIKIYDEGSTTSIWILKYTGSAQELTLPTAIEYNGKTYTGEFVVGKSAFEGNTTLKKVIIPNAYGAILEKAFYGCSNLEEVIIGSGITYMEDSVFVNCPKLKIFRLANFPIGNGPVNYNYGFGRNDAGEIYPDVTAYVVRESDIANYIEQRNPSGQASNIVTLVYENDPAKAANTTKVLSDKEDTDGSFAPASAFEEGADEADADKAATSWAKESDPEGSVFYLLQLKQSKVTAKSVKISWKKIKGAAKYVVYGNECGTKNRLKKLTTTKSTSANYKKILKKKVKKGTYYKFMVIAFDKKNKVITTSKVVHIATKKGKKGNDKKVTTKAKKNKVTLAVKKTFKLGAKAVPESKKLKVSRHRKIHYESSDKTVATVNGKGVITAKKKGKCVVYAYAQNGFSAAVKVTVK